MYVKVLFKTYGAKQMLNMFFFQIHFLKFNVYRCCSQKYHRIFFWRVSIFGLCGENSKFLFRYATVEIDRKVRIFCSKC